MLKQIKIALRINNDAYDDELQVLIEACKKDLELSGIASSNINETDPIINQAITYYCKSNFGFDNPDAERFKISYESLKSFLCLNYKEPIVSEGENE